MTEIAETQDGSLRQIAANLVLCLIGAYILSTVLPASTPGATADAFLPQMLGWLSFTAPLVLAASGVFFGSLFSSLREAGRFIALYGVLIWLALSLGLVTGIAATDRVTPFELPQLAAAAVHAAIELIALVASRRMRVSWSR